MDAKAARARVAAWLSDLKPAEAKPLKALLASHKLLNTLFDSLAESSPYLWELVSNEPARLLRLLNADPDNHLKSLLAETRSAVAATGDLAQAMRLLRRMKAEAALLIALADIGGVWPVMRATHALTDLADTAVDAAARFAIAEAVRAGRLNPKDKTNPLAGSGYIVLAMGKMGAFELNYSSDIDLIVLYDPAAPAVPKDAEAASLFVRLTQRLVKLVAGARRRRLRIPHRFAAAARSGLDGNRDLDRGGAVLLRKHGSKLGTRRHDQGARLRRRHRGR